VELAAPKFRAPLERNFDRNQMRQLHRIAGGNPRAMEELLIE